MYAKVENGAIVQYPYSRSQLFADNPDTSFPANLPEETLAAYNVVPVVMTGAPAFDSLTQAAEQTTPAFEPSRNRWEVQWAVRALTPAEITRQQEALQADIVRQTQARLDAFAQTRNYDGILSACTYASSSVPKFQIEGQYCVDMRDDTWARLYEMLAEVQAGTRPVPTSFADIEPELPTLVWPN